MALRRCGDPSAGAVLSPHQGSSKWDFVRADSEVTGVELYAFRALGLHWYPAPIPPAKAAELLRRLASSPTVDPGAIVEIRAASLKIRFRDGVAATVTASSQGWVQYQDNRYYRYNGFFVDNRQLASDILATVELIKS